MDMKAAIFDMDGTLINSLIFWEVLWQGLSDRFLGGKPFAPSAEDDKKVRTLTLRDSMYLIHRNYHIGESGEELDSIAKTMIRDFYANQVELKPGAKEFLEHCREKGVKMCIASATDSYLVAVAMKHCGIDQYFSKVFSCGDIGKGKEHPDVYLLAKDYLGEKAEDIWVFEDSLVAVETAVGIGMKTVAIYDPCNYGQEKMKQIAMVYVDKGETLLKLV